MIRKYPEREEGLLSQLAHESKQTEPYRSTEHYLCGNFPQPLLKPSTHVACSGLGRLDPETQTIDFC